MVRAWSQDGCICSADAQSVDNLACYLMNNLNRVRRRFILCIIVLFAFALLDLSAQRVRLFVKIFFEHSGISITQDEIALRHADDTGRLRPPLIPKNIHQVWHNWSEESMPEDWQEDRQTCIDRNLGWNYTVSCTFHITWEGCERRLPFNSPPDLASSYGPPAPLETSLQPTILGFSKHTMATATQYREQIPSATFFSVTTAAYTST